MYVLKPLAVSVWLWCRYVRVRCSTLRASADAVGLFVNGFGEAPTSVTE